ncbi:MAG: DNA polymerase III subunit delta' [Bacteroidales bacterium]|nr:DNA polymerase III subunit delta' [Bacteroidales bacterium]
MKFSQINGNESLKSRLKAMVDSGKLGHAFLFVEEEGMGALPMALALAQYINCKGEKDGDSCGVCSNCYKIEKLIHPDLHFSYPVNASPLLSEAEKKKPTSDMFLNEWRELCLSNPYFSEQDLYSAFKIEGKQGNISVNEAKRIIDVLSLKPLEADNKVMIIFLAERMNSEAANKLLKLLEEPPAGTYFFLIAQQPSRLLTTIVSRCQLIRLQPESPRDLAAILSKEKGIDESDALNYARVAAGSYGRAIKLIEENESEKEYEQKVKELFEVCLNKNLVEVISTADSLAEMGREQQKTFCRQAELLIRKLFMFANGAGDISLAQQKEYDYLETLASRIKPDFYEKGLKIFDSALVAIESNTNSKLLFLDICNRLYMML